MNPFVNDFNELYTKLKESVSKDSFVFVNAESQNSIFEKLLVQTLVRTINGNSIKFIGVRVVELKPEYKSNGEFTKFIDLLIGLKHPILIHDIVNDRLIEFFYERKFGLNTETKYGKTLLNMFRINFD